MDDFPECHESMEDFTDLRPAAVCGCGCRRRLFSYTVADQVRRGWFCAVCDRAEFVRLVAIDEVRANARTFEMLG